MAIRKLKRTQLYTGASRPAYVPGLQVPLGVAVFLCAGGGYTVILFSDWRWWIVDLTFWIFVWLYLRILLKRDHNALRVLAHGLRKIFNFDDHIWGGSTQFSWPVRDRTPTPRGIPYPYE